MSIRGYVGDCVFAPEALSAMSEAFEAATEILGIGRDEIKRRAVARSIIRLAREGCDLDATAMRDRAVAAMGETLPWHEHGVGAYLTHAESGVDLQHYAG
jgi:hypothetical protein